ncbi:peptidase domain-containing ABC transporter [Cytophagaceae bacterium YF14B1]|uniref:Peptidase domain-containing ABC transporter n=2 Tax=Xanthocytophaga flava TaxID=3048013 RepID=A0AAE3QZI8_9BACT|nr:peptidase domain-containing ABC transporter [Xanthocytophaga flavus]MDJ1485604.1 peptidase domain-containing ABC transporter [Xanthocytophaga flavus]
MRKTYRFYRQLDFMDCGPTCLKMISSFYGKDYSLDFFRTNTFITRQGVSIGCLSDAAEKIGFKTLIAKVSLHQICHEVPLPCILHWNQEHFVVLYEVRSGGLFRKEEQFIIADPAHQLVAVNRNVFLNCWIGQNTSQTQPDQETELLKNSSSKGIALLLEPTVEFYSNAAPQKDKPTGFRFLLQYLQPYRRLVLQIVLGMLLSSMLNLTFPFLTQSLVDYGIQHKNPSFIHLILFSQLLLFLGGIAIDMIRNWILLHINTRISVSIISNFLVKLMKLPLHFFESKNIGDISQRINDHHRIETFLTSATLQTLFSLVNLFILSFVLSIYNLKILGVFLVGSFLSIVWMFIFLKKRKDLDYHRFQRLRDNQNNIYELITSMQEIKLNNCEKSKRWEWERIQAKLFKINIQSLTLEQYQEIGFSSITQGKNILVSYLAASLVIENQITLGMMLSISYIIGQMNGPLGQIVGFMKSIQDAKISLERLGEIHNRQEEEETDQSNGWLLSGQEALLPDMAMPADTIGEMPADPVSYHQQTTSHVPASAHPAKAIQDPGLTSGISIAQVSFRYGGPRSKMVLNDATFHIPKGKVTAIVGASGSGKTTIVKLLLKFYEPSQGEILIDGTDLNHLSARWWRSQCGTVMQDGYIFSDTIARNIAVEGTIDRERLVHAIQTANLHEYVQRLPLGLNTYIGNTGAGLSGGQRQRILIARAVYKNPEYIFFDEATSALDANNEKVIIHNLNHFFKGRTVIVIAHRLSTVRNADQIIVMHNGAIIEQGTHHTLCSQQGYYFELVRNQLELAVQ